MAANVTRIPVAMKRGRKVTKGPVASLSVLYGAPSGGVGRTLNLEEEAEKLAHLVADRAIRVEREAREREEWLDSSPTVTRFPASARFRTRQQVDRLKHGLPEDDEQEGSGGVVDELGDRIGRRAHEIIQSRKKSQETGQHTHSEGDPNG